MHPNQTKNDAAYRARQRQAGVARVTVMCPQDRVEELKTLVAMWRQESSARRSPR
jgi:hypothetical protein